MMQLFFLFKQKTAYEMRIRYWSSDVCSSDLSRDGGVIDKLFFHHIAEILVAGQFGLYEIGIGQFVGVAHPVYQDDFLETIVDVRILDDAHERSKAGSGGEKIKIPARFQIVDQQGTQRLAADQNRITTFQMLHARTPGAVLSIDSDTIEVFH